METAEPILLSSALARTLSPTPPVDEYLTISPEPLTNSNNLNLAENEAFEKRLAENHNSQIFLRTELKELEQKEKMPKTP